MENGAPENQIGGLYRRILSTAGFAVAVSAFILPRLLTDLENDTKSLVRNNIGVLIQRVTGEENTITGRPSFPSSPSRDAGAIILLLAWGFTCPITCYFILLVRQKWRCECGGWPNQPQIHHTTRCPAKFLDDVIPLLLQTGFILTCASIALYLYHLNTATSVIVAIPPIIAIAFSGIYIVPLSRRFLALCFKPRNDLEAEEPSSRTPTALFQFPSSIPEPPLKGEFQLQKKVAAGAFGEVYKGIWIPPDGKPLEVAIKCIRKDNLTPTNNQATGESRYNTRILREIVIWYKMVHQNILKFIGHHVVDGEIRLISPWCKNGTLASYIRNHPKLSQIERLKLILGAAHGLKHLHDFLPPVAHGDVKAENFLITWECEVLLCDFGVSRLVISFPKSGLTTAGQGTGSPGHQAKELFKENCPSTLASDMYAFGGVILTAMTGEPPFYKMKNKNAIIIAINNDETAKPEDHPGLSENHPLWDLMRRCWDPNPVRRPNIGQVIDEIEAQIQRISADLPRETIDEGLALFGRPSRRPPGTARAG